MVKRSLVLSIFLLLLPLLSHAEECATACTKSGTTYTCSDASLECIQDAVTAATVGDTVRVTDTTDRTWASALMISNGVTISGPGAANLTITASEGIVYSPSVGASDNTFEFYGFTVNFAPTKYFQIGNVNNKPTSSENNKLTKTKIHDNVFSGSPVFWLYTGVYGVIYKNVLTCGIICVRSTNNQLGGDNWTYWSYYPGSAGGGDQLYFEDNVITVGDATDAIVQSSQGGHRYAYRYNTININGAATPLWDAHGNGTNQYAATMGVELYGNTLHQVSGLGYLQLRGGQATIFYNDNLHTTWTTDFREEEADNHGPGPATHSITSQPQHISSSYVWGSRADTTGSLVGAATHSVDPCTGCEGESSCVDDADACYHGEGVAVPTENYDWWQDAAGCTNEECAIGIGCGAVAPSGTCTTGVAYWVTSNANSCTTLSGLTGASTDVTGGSRSPSTKITGTLYKCTATNTWTPYYTPYTYPHPLRGESGSGHSFSGGATHSWGSGATHTFQ